MKSLSELGWLCFFCCCCCQLFAKAHAQELNSNLTEAISSIANIGVGISEGIPQLIPTCEQIIQLPIQVAVGLPTVLFSFVITNLCALVVATGNLDPQVTPDITKMNFELRTPCARITVPLLEAEQLWLHAEFNASRPVVIAVSGFTTNVNNSDFLNEIAKAYNCRDDNNFVVSIRRRPDHSSELKVSYMPKALDTADYLDTLYTWAAFNTEEIGRQLGIGLLKLSKIVPISNVHLIGHSIGAHIIGFAARYYESMTGMLLPYLTGLDPAKPCFKRGQMLEPIERGIATFIDIVHSNANGFGKLEALGDVDFYPNGIQALQPGCLDPICSHQRSYQYYAETIYPANAYNFPARACSSLTALLAGFCNNPDYPMGYAVPKDITGEYYLAVNDKEPYGKNASRDFQSSGGPCGRCQSYSVNLK